MPLTFSLSQITFSSPTGGRDTPIAKASGKELSNRLFRFDSHDSNVFTPLYLGETRRLEKPRQSAALVHFIMNSLCTRPIMKIYALCRKQSRGSLVRVVISVTRQFQAACIIITTTAASRGTSLVPFNPVSLLLSCLSSRLCISHTVQKYIAFRADRKRISKNPLKAVDANRFLTTSETPRSPNESIETGPRFKSPCTGTTSLVLTSLSSIYSELNVANTPHAATPPSRSTSILGSQFGLTHNSFGPAQLLLRLAGNCNSTNSKSRLSDPFERMT